jgi:hypothetical protein
MIINRNFVFDSQERQRFYTLPARIRLAAASLFWKRACGNRRPSARGAIVRNSVERFRRLDPGHARTQHQPHDPKLHKPTYEQGLRVERRHYETKHAWPGQKRSTKGSAISHRDLSILRDYLSAGCSKRRFARSSGVGFNSPLTLRRKLRS